MKNLFTNLMKNTAKRTQNTGGGASQCQTSRSEGARQITARFESAQMKTTSLISGCSALDVPMPSYGASDEHPMSTRSASDGRRWNSRGWKYVACMLMVLFMGVGNVWGTPTGVDAYYKCTKPSSDVISNVTPTTGDGTYFSAYSAPTKTAGSFAQNADTLRLNVPASTNATLSFTYTAKQAISISSFRIYATTSSDKIKTANISYTGNNTGVSKTFSKGAKDLKTSYIDVEPASDIEIAKDGTFTININLSNTDGSNERNLRMYRITLNVSAAGGGGGATTYDVNIADLLNGSITASPTSQEEREDVTLTVSPSTGYELSGDISVTGDESGDNITATDNGDGTWTFEMPGEDVTVDASFSLIDYSVSKTLTYCAVKDGSTAIPLTMNYGGDLSTTIEPLSGYLLPSSITVSGVTSYTWNALTGALTLTDVTGNVSISIVAATPQTGSGATVTYAMVTSGSTAATYSTGVFTGILSGGTSNKNTLVASNTLSGGNGVGVQSDKTTPKSSRTAGITSSTGDFSAGSSPYAEFTFDVVDGYTFTPTAISVPVLAITNNAYFTAIVTDGSSTWTSATSECPQGEQATINATPSGGSALTGTVNIRVFCHNQAKAAKGFRIGTGSVTITGTVAAETPACSAPTSPSVTSTNWIYVPGEGIELTASATETDASTTYTWYKGATLETAKAAGAIQAAMTSAEGGTTYSIASCSASDAYRYWCVISNGTGCEASA